MKGTVAALACMIMLAGRLAAKPDEITEPWAEDDTTAPAITGPTPPKPVRAAKLEQQAGWTEANNPNAW